MPAEIVPAEFCATYWGSYEVSGSKGDTYHVTLYGGEGPADCRKDEGPCPAFKFSGNRDCKHISYVWQHACLWNPQWHDGGPGDLKPTDIYERTIAESKCPACGGPTVAVRIAV